MESGKGASAFERREANRVWNKQQADAQSTPNSPKISTVALAEHFEKLPQSKLIPDFLRFTQELFPGRKGALVNTVARLIHPGRAWLDLLKEYNNDSCRLLAQRCIRQWNAHQVSTALIQGIKKALQEQDENLLAWLKTLTLEIANARSDVSLRSVERFLWNRCKERISWWRTNKRLGEQVQNFHESLTQLIAPADTPLAATAPRTDRELPLPAEAGQAAIDSLPVPSEGTGKPGTGFWQRLVQRFRR